MEVREYAVYKGEEIIAMGTLEECAKQLDVKPDSIYFYSTPTYAKRSSEKKGRRTVRIY